MPYVDGTPGRVHHTSWEVAAALGGRGISLLRSTTPVEGKPTASESIELDLDDLSADPDYRHALSTDPDAFTAADTLGSLQAALPPAWDIVAREGASVRLPVLLINGELDEIAPAADTAAAAQVFPDRTVEVVPGGRHDILNDVSHAEVASRITDFVVAQTTSRLHPAADASAP